MPIERKLAAIMFTDIAGYTEQMSKDEAVAISLLNKKESVLKPLIAKHNGTYVKSTGDGSLSHFNSAVDAATCAKRLQESIYDDKDLNVRVGVHLGDTIFEKGDIRGDGVNIASRLESMAVEGGVFVSKEVHDQLANQKEFDGVSLGLQSMKGVGRLIEVYGLKGDKLNEPKPSEYQDNKVDKHSDDEVPSIAIIPFENKGAEEDAFYSYGISADLISDVTSAGIIRVSSKTDIEKLDYRNLDNTELSQKLFVRYIANGELWRMEDMFQLSMELYDAKDKKVIWSDRWQEKWNNLPIIKGSLTDGLLKAFDIKSKLIRRLDSENAEAYELYLKAKFKYINIKSNDDIKITRQLLKKAIELDENLLLAKTLLGLTYLDSGKLNKATNIFTSVQKQAEEIGDTTGVGLMWLGLIHVYKGEYDLALKHYNTSFIIKKEVGDKPGMSWLLLSMGVVYAHMGDINKAFEYNEHSLNLNEEMIDRLGMGMNHHCRGFMSWKEGDLETALMYWEQSLNILKHESAWAFFPYSDIGIYYFDKGDYDVAIRYLEKSYNMQKELKNKEIFIWTTTILLLSYKNINKQYDETVIHSIIKEATHIEDYINFSLFKLLEDTSYLKTAYNQIQEKADNLEPDVAAKFLSYPIPKAIVEEWEKVK